MYSSMFFSIPGCGLHRRTVEAEDGQSGIFVEVERDVFSGLGVAADAVLGAVERDQLELRPARKRSIVRRRRPSTPDGLVMRPTFFPRIEVPLSSPAGLRCPA